MPSSLLPGQAVTPIRDLWLPVTVHVAWTLVKRGYTVTPNLLADAREHVLRSIDLALSVDQVEWLTPGWVDHYLARRIDHKVLPAPTIGPEVHIPARSWQIALLEDADRAMEAVFRFCYAEGMSLERAATHFRCAVAPLKAARARLRDSVRQISSADAASIQSAEEDVVDKVLQRLATLASEGAPGPMGLTSAMGLAQAEHCPRTARAVRLIRNGHLEPRSLFPPNDDAVPTQGVVTVVCLLLHPDARKQAAHLSKRLNNLAVPAGNGSWLLQIDSEGELYESLAELCAMGRPARHHIRAARAEGSGRWSGRTLLGPVANSALDAARAAPWGDICGRPPLPLPAPPLPTAHRWWAGAVASAAATLALGISIAQPAEIASPTPVEARFQHAADGWDVTFDLPDRALLDVVVVDGGAVRILHRSIGATRGAWATGHGDFRAKIPGDQVALLSSQQGIPELERLVLDAAQHPDPLEALEQILHTIHPHADFARSRPTVAAVEVAGPVVAPL